MSGEAECFSCQISSTSANVPNADKPKDNRQRARVHALRLFQRENDRADEHHEQQEARRVERRPPPTAGLRLQAHHHEHGGEPERDVHPKDRAPAEGLRKIAAGDRPERRRGDRYAGEIALIAAALARRNGLADQRLRERHQSTAAESLQHARRGEELDVRRERAQHRSEHEQEERGEHHRLAAEGVAEAAVNRRCDRVGDQIRNHYPGDTLDLAEVGRHRRQRGGDDRLIGYRHEHRQHDRGKHRPEQRARRRLCRLRSRFGGCGGRFGFDAGDVFFHSIGRVRNRVLAAAVLPFCRARPLLRTYTSFRARTALPAHASRHKNAGRPGEGGRFINERSASRFSRGNQPAPAHAPRLRSSVAPAIAAQLPSDLHTEASATRCAHPEIRARRDARPTCLC